MKISKKTQERLNAGLDKYLGARMLTPSEITASANWPLVEFNHSTAPLSPAQIGQMADHAFALPTSVLMASPACTHHSVGPGVRPRQSLLDIVFADLVKKGLLRG